MTFFIRRKESLSTAWKMARVVLYMLRVLWGYTALGLWNRGRRPAFLVESYLGWAGYIMRVFDVHLEVQGRENLPRPGDRPLIVLSNHQSQLDIPALGLGVGTILGYVAKKELARFPVLAYFMREIGCVFIDRKDRFSARKSLEVAAASLATGGHKPLVVFPEGTRSKTGSLLPLKMGGFRMAVLSGATVVPAHIRGTRNAFEARPAGAATPIPARVRFFPSLDTAGWPDEKAAWYRIRDYLEQCWAEGEREGADAPEVPLRDGR